MELNVEFAELRKRKIFLATPMYGGNCAGMFAKSVSDLAVLCTKYGVGIQEFFLFNESLITRARNYCVDEFLRSDCTHLMFIDSDIGFDPNDVITLLALQDDASEYDVLCGPYPKKCISWEKIIQGVNKGFGDKDPAELEQLVGDFVFNPVVKEGQTHISLGEPAEVLEAGTGFMMIRKEVFAKYAESYPLIMYRPDHVRTNNFDGSRKIGMYFQAEIDPESERYLSEDYLFCQNVRKMGRKVWLCPWMKLYHVGTYVFSGSLQAMSLVGASATADVSKVRKTSGQITRKKK